MTPQFKFKRICQLMKNMDKDMEKFMRLLSHFTCATIVTFGGILIVANRPMGKKTLKRIYIKLLTLPKINHLEKFLC